MGKSKGRKGRREGGGFSCGREELTQDWEGCLIMAVWVLVFVGGEIRVIEDRGYVFVCRLLRIEWITDYSVGRVGLVGAFVV